MRKLFFLLIVFGIIAFLGFKYVRQSVSNDLAKPVSLPSSTPSPAPSLKQVKGAKSIDISQSLFVPYWAVGSDKIDAGDFKNILYFGITPGTNGINKTEAGYTGIDKFVASVPNGHRTELVIRMIDSNTNFAILKDQARQSSIIKDSISIAKENGFSGIVLDLEVSAVPFDSLIKQINEFTNRFYGEAKNKNLHFSLMLYGDSFYRLRPFDIKALSKNADSFLIMAYDFSKSRGNPGPNFPLKGKEIYGYDMARMSEDFLQFLPPEKTSVAFGLFGYDWTVDDKGSAASSGEAKTYQQIKKEFLNGCKHKDCDIKRKNDSVETEITYTDGDNKKHILWFEDLESVAKKKKYLQEKGINNFSFWAYSYF